jgi:hypothetical protein
MFKEDLKTASVIVGEKQNVLLSITMGFWLILPWQTFNEKVFTVIGSKLTEAETGYYLLLLGVIHLYSYVVSLAEKNVLNKYAQGLRRVCIFIETITWSVLAVSFLFGNISSLYGIIYTWFGIVSYLSFVGYKYVSRG